MSRTSIRLTLAISLVLIGMFGLMLRLFPADIGTDIAEVGAAIGLAPPVLKWLFRQFAES